ncbi:uncharacterized protein LOC103569219 [Microplitis demolitor]|uniref:uncharacterized protein LOC103569219 n=1 Tax=Microplitis demolitor TaxID=69319 RepID=UPI0004CC9D25|nr:uncharacterized protein LOC103569219 [Microplitis demolitor]
MFVKLLCVVLFICAFSQVNCRIISDSNGNEVEEKTPSILGRLFRASGSIRYRLADIFDGITNSFRNAWRNNIGGLFNSFRQFGGIGNPQRPNSNPAINTELDGLDYLKDVEAVDPKMFPNPNWNGRLTAADIGELMVLCKRGVVVPGFCNENK